MTSTAERRFTTVPVETRAAAADKRTIGGYAAKFDTTSRNLGGFVETIATRAFNKSRGDGWPGVIARYNHDDNMVLGTTGGGTLRLGVDDIGLTYEADLPSARADVHELIQRGDVRQSSFAFVVHEDEWGETDQNFPIRRLLSVRLLDVAPVNSPAYEDTSVGVRSLADEQRSVGGALVGPAAAFESLARAKDASVDEVRALAAEGELRKFFRRTDEAPPAFTVRDALKAWR
ncbi:MULTISPECIES: HK97 family phage prohead protease [unclassified Isoptericola]|uniref:HK97 family phage prohead protease n=1 Tax=unclassified Isoptericola TaxID=2623355 RepID=UPI0036604D22